MVEPTIQMTLFDYFKDVDNFTLSEAIECVQAAKAEINAPVKEPSIRARIYEEIDKGLFTRVSKGVYTVKKENNTCLLINGNGRDLSFIADESIDCLITDHPYLLNSSLKGGNRDFARYECFQYEQEDFNEKARVIKSGCFLVEFFPEENSENYRYIYQCKEMAQQAGLEYYSTVNWKKGDFVSNTGRKSKNTEQVVFFTKGKSRCLKRDAKKEKQFYENHDLVIYSNDLYGEYFNIKLYVERGMGEYLKEKVTELYYAYASSPLNVSVEEYIKSWLTDNDYEFIDATDKDIHFYMSGTNGMLPTEFDVPPIPKSDKIHQAEKPVELIKRIIDYVTLPEEKILDQFAGSGVVGEAALDTGRDSILIEKDMDTFNKAYERINKKKGR